MIPDVNAVCSHVLDVFDVMLASPLAENFWLKETRPLYSSLWTVTRVQHFGPSGIVLEYLVLRSG